MQASVDALAVRHYGCLISIEMYEALHKLVCKFRTDIESMEDETNEDKERIYDLEREVEVLEEAADSLQDQFDALMDALQESKKKISDLEDEVVNLEVDADTVQKQMDELTDELQGCRKQLEDAQISEATPRELRARKRRLLEDSP